MKQTYDEKFANELYSKSKTLDLENKEIQILNSTITTLKAEVTEQRNLKCCRVITKKN